MTTPRMPPSTISPPPNPSLDEEDPLSTIHLLLGSKLRVTMTDGRVAHGNFVCLDRLGNIILEDVLERREVAYVQAEASGERKLYTWDTERSLSQAVIPGEKLEKVEISKKEWEARVGRSGDDCPFNP